MKSNDKVTLKLTNLFNSIDSIHSIPPSGGRPSHAAASAHAAPIWRGDGDVDVVANHEAFRSKRGPVIRTLDSRLRLSDGAQLVARGPHVRINYAKFEQSSLPPRVRINLLDERGELLQGGVHPCVNLQFVGGRDSASIFTRVMMSVLRTENSEEEWASLLPINGFLFIDRRFHVMRILL